MHYSRNDCKALTEEMRQMFPKPLEKRYYNEIIDCIKKDKKYGFRHIALKIMVDGLEEHNREHQKYIDLQKEYFVLKHKCIGYSLRTLCKRYGQKDGE